MGETDTLKKWINESNYIVFFGGAGVSTESNIPDFRSTDGLYHQEYDYPPEMILSHSFYMRKPEEFYRFYRNKMLFPNAKPNRAHLALAKLEQEGKLKADGAVEVVKEVAPALKDGRFILVLRKLVVNVLVLDRLGVKSICDTADAVWEHPLIRDAVLRRNLLFIGLVRPGDGGFDLLSLGAGQFSLFR